jgi:hypothetical protein
MSPEELADLDAIGAEYGITGRAGIIRFMIVDWKKRHATESEPKKGKTKEKT